LIYFYCGSGFRHDAFVGQDFPKKGAILLWQSMRFIFEKSQACLGGIDFLIFIISI
jgi:hypothetical protein